MGRAERDGIVDGSLARLRAEALAGDFALPRACVGKDGRPADPSPDNALGETTVG